MLMCKSKILALLILSGFLSVKEVNAQAGITEIIKAGVKKVIKAVDLKIQRLQNKTIWLQNAQKVLENTLSKLKLDEISDWTEKQKEQYQKYFDELAQVKAIITSYQRIRDIITKQVHLVDEYKRVWQMIQQDNHFSPDEISYMEKVYTGILDESIENLDQIQLILKSYTTKMSDAKRLELINNTADQIDTNYSDLVLFNQQNMLLSLQRAKTLTEVQEVKKLYELP